MAIHMQWVAAVGKATKLTLLPPRITVVKSGWPHGQPSAILSASLAFCTGRPPMPTMTSHCSKQLDFSGECAAALLCFSAPCIGLAMDCTSAPDASGKRSESVAALCARGSQPACVVWTVCTARLKDMASSGVIEVTVMPSVVAERLKIES